MKMTVLRKVGGSVMMTVPPAILEELSLAAGATVGIDVEGGRLIVQPRKPKYTLEELLAQCEGDQEITAEEREWLDSPPVGRELI
jgi:antitoxin ChpS